MRRFTGWMIDARRGRRSGFVPHYNELGEGTNSRRAQIRYRS